MGSRYIISIAVYVGAAVAEIAGCFAFWAWLRLDKSVWWLVPGMGALALFAWLLTLADVTAAAGPTQPTAASTLLPPWLGCGRWKACGLTAGIPRAL